MRHQHQHEISAIADVLSMALGRHRAPCPKCGKGRSDRALSIKVDESGACWYCWRCEDSGGIPRSERAIRFDRTPARDYSRAREQLNKLGGNTEPLGLAKHPIAAKYLASRGLDVRDNPPADLRYGKVDYWQRGPVHVGSFPCIVAVIQDADGQPPSLRRTYLAPDGSGRADVDPTRKLCSSCRPGGLTGSAVRLYEAHDALILAEGIKDQLGSEMAPPEACMGAPVDEHDGRRRPARDGTRPSHRRSLGDIEDLACALRDS